MIEKGSVADAVKVGSVSIVRTSMIGRCLPDAEYWDSFDFNFGSIAARVIVER